MENMTCIDCQTALTPETAIACFTDDVRCFGCNDLAWERLCAKAAAQPGTQANDVTNVWH